MKTSLLTALLALALAACGDAETPSPRVRLATTTSTENSGLLDDLLPPFEEATGLRVDVVAVGTGKALALGERGDADIILVHARAREDTFVAAGHGVDRRDICWNDFVILGPNTDSAGVRGSKDAAAALSAIAKAGAVFVSRGDDSGTHTRERQLWEAAGGRPDWANYLEAGQGMGPCLTIADEKRGYVLADRGTYLARRADLGLEVLVEGDARLHNPYGAMIVNPARHGHVNEAGARKLLDYLTSPEGRKRIREFRVQGEALFHAAGDPSDPDPE